MIYKITFFIILQFFEFIYGQFPIELFPNETSQDIFFSSDIATEYLLSLTALSNTDWSEEGSESSNLTISIDNDWDHYNQDIVLYAGSSSHTYNVSLGPISEGNHSITFKFDHSKSSSNSTFILIESIELIDIKFVILLK